MSEFTLVKMPQCWKLHVAAQLFYHQPDRPFLIGVFNVSIMVLPIISIKSIASPKFEISILLYIVSIIAIRTALTRGRI